MSMSESMSTRVRYKPSNVRYHANKIKSKRDINVGKTHNNSTKDSRRLQNKNTNSRIEHSIPLLLPL
jgi:hypothetical protein